MSDPDLARLRVFLAVVEAGTISAAAARLSVTRSAVSQQVSALERSLGVALFQRSGRRLTPTEAGERLFRTARPLHEALRESLEQARGEADSVRGTVRLGVYLGFPRSRLADLLDRFHGAHPEARVRVQYGAQAELRDLLVAQRLDFLFSLAPADSEPRRLRATRLFEHALVLVAAGRRLREGVTLERLRRTPVVDYYPRDPLIHRWARHHFRARRPRIPVRTFAATTDLVLELALRDVGVAVLPRDLVEPWLRRRRLRILETSRPELRDAVWLEERREETGPARLTAFRQVLLEEKGGYAGSS